MDIDRLHRKMLSSWVTHKRPVGSPEITYGRALFKALKKANVDSKHWFDIAMDRVEWRNILSNVS